MRAIVRDPDIRSGKWRLDGTRITVGDVRRWATQFTLEQINDDEHWPHLQLTQEELDACLAWEYPALGAARLVFGTEICFRCACGEDIETGGFDDPHVGEFPCDTCGRSWRVDVLITQATPDAGAGEGRE